MEAAAQRVQPGLWSLTQNAVSCMLHTAHAKGGVMTAALPRLAERPDRLAQIVFDAIRSAIIDKTLPPGSSTSEVALARMLDVSKTPVREAVLRLCDLHLLERDGVRGLKVVSPSMELITQAYELRVAVEAQAAALAARRATADQQRQIRELAERSLAACQADDAREFRTWDVELHRLVAQCSGSHLLTEIACNAIDLTDVLRRRDAPMGSVSLRCAHDHVDLADAIEERRPEEARTLIVGHIEAVQNRVLEDFMERNAVAEGAVH